MAVEPIADAADSRLADYRDLRDGELRERRGVFVAEGRQIVRRLLGGTRFRTRSVLVTETALADLADALGDGVPVYVAREETIKEVVGFDFHRGCVAVGERDAPLDAGGLLGGRRVLVLERVTNPDNVGAAFRSAVALGADAVLLSPGCADPLYRKAIRVSMGGTLRVPFASLRDWPADLERLRAAGFTVVALTPDGSVDLAELGVERPLPERLALVVGAEGEGLSTGARAAADLTVAIRMVAGDHSLNVATAAGIALHHLAR